MKDGRNTGAMTDTERRLHHAAQIIETSRGNDFDGGDDLSKFADARYAVTVERDDDGWVLAARDLKAVAAIEYDCHYSTEGYDEWIEAVYDLNTGEPVVYEQIVIVRLWLDGETVEYRTDRPA